MNIKEQQDKLNKNFGCIMWNMENMRESTDIIPTFRIEEFKPAYTIMDKPNKPIETKYNIYMMNKDDQYIGKIWFALMSEQELGETLYVINKFFELIISTFGTA